MEAFRLRRMASFPPQGKVGKDPIQVCEFDGGLAAVAVTIRCSEGAPAKQDADRGSRRPASTLIASRTSTAGWRHVTHPEF
jgi:hypothetical protein